MTASPPDAAYTGNYPPLAAGTEPPPSNKAIEPAICGCAAPRIPTGAQYPALGSRCHSRCCSFSKTKSHHGINASSFAHKIMETRCPHARSASLGKRRLADSVKTALLHEESGYDKLD